jgi:vancomycin resistance protein VanJ
MAILDRLRTISAGCLAAYAVVIAILSIVNILAPQRNGLLALSQIFAPHLWLSVLVLAPVAFRFPRPWLLVPVVVALSIGLLRFGPGLVSVPPRPPAADETVVRLLSWNLEGNESTPSDVVARLRTSDADVVALQELTADHADAIRTDDDLSTQYPDMALFPRGGADGLGILSRFPIGSAAHDLHPAVQEVHVSLSDRELVIINAHPFAPSVPVGRPVRFGFDARQRDIDILRIRRSIDRVLGMTRPVIVLGDFNVTDREPAFEDLARGLWDAHEEVGQGIGSTWRPNQIGFLPFGLLRIDHFLGGPGTRPLSIGEECVPSSDHCILTGVAAVSPHPGGGTNQPD